MKHDVDVIVIGGGVAGLAAAGVVARAGLQVKLFEARDRLGGRVYTVHEPGWPVPVELGAEFLDVPGAAWDVLRSAGGTAVRSVGGWWRRQDDRFVSTNMRERIDSVLRHLPTDPENDVVFAEWLRQTSHGDQDARDLATRYVEGFHAAPVDEIGIGWLARAEQVIGGGGGPEQFHSLGGYGKLVDALRVAAGERCEVHLSTIVTRIDWSADGVEVHACNTAGHTFGPVRARCAIVTVPVGVLQAPENARGAITFDPPLHEKADALSRVAMGDVVKVVLRFREPIWERAPGLFEAARREQRSIKFLFAEGPVPTWWTMAPLVAPVLVAWAGGSYARRLRDASSDLLPTIVASLAATLGLPETEIAPLLDGFRYHDWEADPFARGAYSFGRPGAAGASEVLAQPIGRTLYFAGEATAGEEDTATVNAALESGWRAGKAVVGDR